MIPYQASLHFPESNTLSGVPGGEKVRQAFQALPPSTVAVLKDTFIGTSLGHHANYLLSTYDAAQKDPFLKLMYGAGEFAAKMHKLSGSVSPATPVEDIRRTVQNIQDFSMLFLAKMQEGIASHVGQEQVEKTVSEGPYVYTPLNVFG